MDPLEREIKIKTLEAEIEHLTNLRRELVRKVSLAEIAVTLNDRARDSKRREIIAILKSAS